MSATVTILDPVAPAGIAGSERTFQRLDTLKGKVVGFIDNSKPNFSYLVDDLTELLIARHGVVAVVRHRKLSASIPASEEAIADVKRQCDLVITGSGD
ncbi:MAG: hypothetical protein D4R58_02035 [Betaproteobacteria bacterium]|nr:MAG: hypothetical protein D4R58_02035 [Betaproteobacteria bacterium]